MEFKKRYYIVLLSVFLLSVGMIVSCSEDKRIEQARNIDINEIMASNRTGLLNEKGKPTDWIELKNSSNDSINLRGFKLAVIKTIIDSVAGTEPHDTIMIWDFPNVDIKAGECMVVLTGKSKKDDEKGSALLTADFKLPKEGGVIQFLDPRKRVIKEVKYEEMQPDYSYSLQPDSTYIVTNWQSPGFENTPQGYEAAAIMMDDQRNSELLIWELMSRSTDSYANWVELKNVSDKEISLANYSLAKKMGKKAESWALPDRTLQPGEIITIQLAGKQANTNNPLQATIKLGNSETLVLTKDGKFIDGVNAKATPIGGSIGRSAGKKGFFYYSVPSKNAENGDEGRRFISEAPSFEEKPGIYSKVDTLCLHLKDKSRVVHYTLDGSEPKASSPVLKDSILIKKNTVVRAYAEGDSISLRSPVATDTYLLGVEHTIPVINVSLNHDDMYGYNSGIYADGPGYDQEWPHKGANYWKKMMKNAHVELFDNQDGIDLACGIKIFGGFSRAEAKKSFRLKFMRCYGNSKVKYDFFGKGKPVELENLVLRSGSQDWNRCMLRDEFFTDLLKAESPSLLIQEYRPVALYINAEYFGLYYMREKINSDFVARKLGLPNDSINIIMSEGYNEEGSPIPYKDMIKFVYYNDMTKPENFEKMKNLVDFQGLIDYKLGEIYSGNTDVGNIRYVRSTAKESDKKWYFVFYDLDASWTANKTASYYLEAGTGGNESYVGKQNILINRLLKHPEFRTLFLERLSHHLSTTFSHENVTRVFDSLVEQIKPEMKQNCQRWPQLSYAIWEKNVEEFRAKFKDRPKIILDDLRNHLSITDEENKKYFSHLGF